MVSESTYAPIFMYDGGMTITEGARYAPRRMELPPGTILTLSSRVILRAGMVSLSKKLNCPSDMSVSFPYLKPSRMVSLTQELTFHSPSVRSATRTRPASRSRTRALNFSSCCISFNFNHCTPVRPLTTFPPSVPRQSASSGHRSPARKAREEAAVHCG